MDKLTQYLNVPLSITRLDVGHHCSSRSLSHRKSTTDIESKDNFSCSQNAIGEIRKSTSMPQDMRDAREIEKLDEITNADPMSQSAMSLTHMHMQTSYGFTTLTELPKTWVSESIFHTESAKDGQRRNTLSVSSSFSASALSRNSSFSDTRSEADNCFFSSNGNTSSEESDDKNVSPESADIIKELEDGDLVISVEFLQKKNIYKLTLHRAKILCDREGSREFFAKVCVVPDKIQKHTSKLVPQYNTIEWNQTFVFKKLTIGQLESCSIRIRIFSKSGFLKSTTFHGEATVKLSEVKDSSIDKSVLKLCKDVDKKYGN